MANGTTPITRRAKAVRFLDLTLTIASSRIMSTTSPLLTLPYSAHVRLHPNTQKRDSSHRPPSARELRGARLGEDAHGRGGVPEPRDPLSRAGDDAFEESGDATRRRKPGACAVFYDHLWSRHW
jgi:hypothetical protein